MLMRIDYWRLWDKQSLTELEAVSWLASGKIHEGLGASVGSESYELFFSIQKHLEVVKGEL